MMMKQWFGSIVALCVVGVLSPFLAAADKPTETLNVSGLRQPVEILKDRWGISHIYAKNERDLFFAQGYNVARDRLFSLEMWRRQAIGTVAEVLGPRELKRDIGTRLFAFHGDLKEELNWYHPHGAEIIKAFVGGINAYIAETVRNPKLLSPEFRMLGITPQPWTPEVVITRFNALVENVDDELDLARTIRSAGVEKVYNLWRFQPEHPDLKMDPAIDASLFSDQILEIYHAFRQPLAYSPDELMSASTGVGNAPQLLSPSSDGPREEAPAVGSNNWVISGSRTASGLPILANDPHRAQSAPSLRYWVHLVAPGWNVIGGGEPALPGVSIGHNEYGAWGLTTFGTDSEDLYVYDTNPANPLEYRYRERWQRMLVRKETIAVKGGTPVTVELKYTRHGPVVFEDTSHHKAYAIRAAWREIGGAPYLASLRMDQSRNWEEFRKSCSYSRIPAENMVWADARGNIGYQVVGIAPLRPNWSGLVPVPGDGRYEWNGFLPIEDLPHAVNPQKGFWNTSNNYTIPADWPFKEALHYTWADSFRADRVAEVLGSGRKLGVADNEQLQNDELSMPAKMLVPLLQGLSFGNVNTRQAAERLLHWNYVLDKDSPAAGIYEMWQRRLRANITMLEVPRDVQIFVDTPNMTKIISWLQAPDAQFGPDPVAGRNEMLIRSLDEAVAELTKRLGPNLENWRLGNYHHALILNAMSSALNPDLRKRFDVGDSSRGGDSYTVDSTGLGDNQNAGASFKIIADTSNWDNSVGMNNPGQSGNVDDPHYRDLYSLWSQGKYFPIFFSRSKVQSVTETTFELKPSR